MAESLFNPEHFQHLSHAVSLFPDLEFATFATCYAEGKVSFPVNNFEGLAPLFTELETLPGQIKLRGLTYESAQFFLRPELFPISDIHDFLSKVFLSAVYGSIYHHETGL